MVDSNRDWTPSWRNALAKHKLCFCQTEVTGLVIRVTDILGQSRQFTHPFWLNIYESIINISELQDTAPLGSWLVGKCLLLDFANLSSKNVVVIINWLSYYKQVLHCSIIILMTLNVKEEKECNHE